MEINIKLKENSYNIITGRGILKKLNKYYDISNRKVLVITDSNIPSDYLESIRINNPNLISLVLKPGEETKNFNSYLKIQETLLINNFSRKDILIALGGGVIGDLSAFAASTFKRGLTFINIPTSSLSMIDSSIGGKTAIDFMGVKNVIGTFYQPSLVLIDFSLLTSLPKRQLNNGLVEALKAGYIYDPTILDLFEKNIEENIETIITKSIIAKKYYVEKDEKELNIRKILNYGHSFGHAFESFFGFSDKLYHGEAVGLGMVIMAKDKERIIHYLNNLNISYPEDIDFSKLIPLIMNDKKVDGEYIDMIYVDTIGKGEIKRTKLCELNSILEGGKEYVRRFRK